MARPRALILLIAVAIVAIGIGYYFGFDHGWEKAVNIVQGPKQEEHIAPLAQEGEQANADAFEMGPFEVEASELEYVSGAKGYYAAPAEANMRFRESERVKQDGPRLREYPGVVMIHEWWGLNDNIRDMARQLASEGYHVLAVDLFGKVATTQEEARAQTQSLDQAKALNNMRGALSYLRQQGANSMASLGWCFGGGQSMQLAVSGEQLGATVIYYGNLVTDSAKLAAISWPVLGVFGDQDQSIPVAKVQEFDRALDNLKVQNEIHLYPGVGHAFANPSGANWAPEETRDAWEKTLAFLNANLK